MNKIKIGIAREGKVPPDFRVPLTPEQCRLVQLKYEDVEIIVQNSPIRTFNDDEYREKGLRVQEDLSECDIILGVKEFKTKDLLPGKKYMFFSHTIKKQPYNRELLRDILAKKITLIDYEVLKNRIDKRLIGFGRYAGIVGCYNGFRALGIKTGLYTIKKASECADRKELEEEMKKIVLPQNLKIVATGFGRVGYGAREIFDLLPIMEVSPDEFLNETYDQPVFTHLEVEDYYSKKDKSPFSKEEFYHHPEEFISAFGKYAAVADMYVACHYWSSKSPYILTNDDLLIENSRLRVVADISCDVSGPIACTIKASTIADPLFGYNPKTQQEDDYMHPDNLVVMSVDNLPCELPKDASEDFGNELIRNILPVLFGEDPDRIIARATETNEHGELTAEFAYLQNYIDGIE